jgi:flavocytochrome c
MSSRPHVVVLGGGLAGLAATLSAVGRGAHVTLVDKEPALGGNSAKASSGLSASGTAPQAAAGIADSPAAHFADTMASGGGRSDATLARAATALSASALAWLELHGAPPLDAIVRTGGHSAPRTHTCGGAKPQPVGRALVGALRDAVSALPVGAVTLLAGHRAVELVQDDENATPDKPRGSLAVTGVRIAPVGGGAQHVIAADAVVLATGGFGADHSPTSLLTEFAPAVAALPTTNGGFATGDGAKLARLAGAHLTGMQYVQLHPTAFIDPADPAARTKWLAPESLRGHGGVLLGPSGARFVDEFARRDSVVAAMFSACGGGPALGRAALVLTPAVAARAGAAFEVYCSRGFFWQVSGARGVAEALGGAASEAAVRESLDSYTAAAAAGRCGTTGKLVFPDPLAGAADGLLWLAFVAPAIHYTQGGVSTNAAAELLYSDLLEVVVGSMLAPDETRLAPESSATDFSVGAPASESIGVDDYTGKFERPVLRPVPRLYGAGEVTGGLHGVNRLAGNSLLECAVFGRIAGERASSAAAEVASERAAKSSGPSAATAPARLRPDAFTSLTLRETHFVCLNTHVYRFDLPTPLSGSGFSVGQHAALRVPGTDVVRYFSPISRPDVPGAIDFLVKADPRGSKMSACLSKMSPGDALEVRGPLGGLPIDLRPGRALGAVRRISMIAAGVGIAPMLQLLRMTWIHPVDLAIPIKLVFAAGLPDELAFRSWLERKSRMHPSFELMCCVDAVPAGATWSGHVGLIDEAFLSSAPAPIFAPSADLLVLVCGPPKFVAAMRAALPRLGYAPETLVFMG